MPRTRVLVVYGAKGDLGDELARQLAVALRREGLEADAYEADEVSDLEDYDGVALEGGREGAGWTPLARDFARRHASDLKTLPAWFLPEVPGQAGWAQAIARRLDGAPAVAPRITGPATVNLPVRRLPN